MMLEGTQEIEEFFHIMISSRAAVRALIAVCETDASVVSLLADKFKYEHRESFVRSIRMRFVC